MNILNLNLFRRVYKQSHKSNGFTLIELMVVVVIVATLAAITIIAINPLERFQQASNTKRLSGVNAILNAVMQYGTTNSGDLDDLNIPVEGVDTAAYIGSDTLSGQINLCDDLTPGFISRMPVDPVTGDDDIANDGVTCADYTTGYTIIQNSNGNITVAAPAAEGGEVISATR